MKEQLSFLFDIEGREKTKDWPAAVIAGLLFMALGSFGVAVLSGRYANITLLDTVGCGYLVAVLFQTGVWLIAFVCATNIPGKVLHRIFKIVYYLACALVLLVFSPLILSALLIDKTRLSVTMGNVMGYVIIGGIALMIAVVGYESAAYLSVEGVEFGIFNMLSVTMGITIIAIVAVVELSLYIWKKCFKMDEAEYKGIKRDFWLFRFVAITLCTICINLFKLPNMDIAKAANGIFAIYLAIDRLSNKYTNKYLKTDEKNK